jgi:crossover junction endodeoxyribonuclease RuvC
MTTSERTAQRILGIDPGLNITGYGLLEVTDHGPQVVAAGAIRSTSGASLVSRVRDIHRGLVEVIGEGRPTSVALEELYSHYARPKTAILMGHARGVICLAAAESDLPVAHYAATQIKKLLTGNGRAPKSQMQQAIRHELGLPELPEPADVADALAIALCHYHLGRRNALFAAANSSSRPSPSRPRVLDVSALAALRRNTP